MLLPFVCFTCSFIESFFTWSLQESHMFSKTHMHTFYTFSLSFRCCWAVVRIFLRFLLKFKMRTTLNPASSMKVITELFPRKCAAPKAKKNLVSGVSFNSFTILRPMFWFRFQIISRLKYESISSLIEPLRATEFSTEVVASGSELENESVGAGESKSWDWKFPHM